MFPSIDCRTIVLAAVLLGVSQPATAQPTRYVVAIKLLRAEPGAVSDAYCKYTVTVEVPAGSGFILVPLPFGEARTRPLIQVDQAPDKQLVLTGTILPTQHFGAVAIALQPQPRRVKIDFPEVLLPIKQYSSRQSELAVAVFLHQAHAELSSLVDIAVAQPSALQFEASDFTNSQPAFRQQEFSDLRVVSLGSAVPPDVFLYIAQAQPRPSLLLVVLAPMGILIGILTAPRFVVTGRRALIASIASAIGIIVTLVIFFTVLPTQQRYSDTGLVLTIGTFAGLLLGILGYSLPAWRRTRRASAPSPGSAQT